MSVMVSVCCLAYNHEKYIRDCLEGFAQQQTNFDFEVWVHDDASTDRTPEIIREYCEKYPEIFHAILQEENQYSKGKNIVNTFLVPNFSGKYYALCEGDDYWCDSTKLQKQVDFLEAHPECPACVHNSKNINCKNGNEWLFNTSTEAGYLDIRKIMDHGGAEFHTSSLCFRQEYHNIPEALCIKGIGDYPRAIHLALLGDIFYFPEVMSVHRELTEGSWTERTLGRSELVFAEHLDHVNKMLFRLDDYTNGEYHETISEITERNQAEILYKKQLFFDILINRNLRKRIFKKYAPSWKEQVSFVISAIKKRFLEGS